MSTIIWTILGWVALAAFVAWTWSRAKAHEKALLSKCAPVVCDGDTAVCRDCNGRGFNYSDPDGKQLACQTCEEEEPSAFQRELPL